MTRAEKVSLTEKNALEELQARLKNSLTPKLQEDPTLFYRFLKARDFNVDKAEKMLLKHINWRKVHQVDNILNDFKPREYYPKYVECSFIGFDKDGDTVVYAPSGNVEAADVFKCDTVNGISKSFVWFSEKYADFLRKQSEKTGKECSQISFIIDLDKLTFSSITNKATGELWLLLTNLFQDNYPERMKSAYVINAPSYYVVVFSIIKALMSNAMLQKIHIFGNSGWQEALLNIIDADVLPAFLGGKRTDPDGNPRCPSFVCQGGKIPTDYYLSDEDRYFKDMSGVKCITIPHATKEEIPIDVSKNGSLIQWEFYIKSKDIRFGLFFQSPEKNVMEVILPSEKYCTVDGKETNSYKAQTVGRYIIIFDNTHSWMNSKEVQYRVTVTEPE